MKSHEIKHGGGKTRLCGCGCGRRYHRRNIEERWFFNGKTWTKVITAISTTCAVVEAEQRRRLNEYTPAWLDPKRTQ